MSLMQWLVLIAAVAAVIVLYWRMRGARDEDPWKSSRRDAGQDPDYERLSAGTEFDAPQSYVVGEPRTVGASADVAETLDGDPGAVKGWEHFAPIRDDEQLRLDMPVGDRRAQRPPAAPPGQEKIIMLHVAAPEGQPFAGRALHNALRILRLQFGMRDVYHRITEANGVPEAVFSVASMVKPGYLDPGQADQFSTPGITFFMVMPGPVEGVVAFRDMLETAQQLAQRLGGEILDDKRTPLTHQTEQYLHDEIAETERRWRVQPRKK